MHSLHAHAHAPRARAPLPLIAEILSLAHQQYNAGRYKEALGSCESIYQREACRTDNLLLLGAVHFQTRNFSECIFYNQQCVRVDPNFAEAYSNLGNALKELGDVRGAIQFYLKVWLASRCGALCGQLCEPKRGGGGVVTRRSRAAAGANTILMKP